MTNNPYNEMPLVMHLLRITIRIFLALVVPLLLVLGGARLVMTALYLNLEYNRPGFPADFYGFSTEDRLRYAPFALNYLMNAEGIAYLGDLTFDDGSPLFNGRELGHMADVKVVTQTVFGIGVAVFLLALLSGAVLWH